MDDDVGPERGYRITEFRRSYNYPTGSWGVVHAACGENLGKFPSRYQAQSAANAHQEMHRFEDGLGDDEGETVEA